MTRNEILKDDLKEIEKLQLSFESWKGYCWQNQMLWFIIKVLRDLLEREVK